MNTKKSQLTRAKTEADDMVNRIQYNIEKKNGLCIRYIRFTEVFELKSYIITKGKSVRGRIHTV